MGEEKVKRERSKKIELNVVKKRERESEREHKRIHGSHYMHTKNILEYDFCRKKSKSRM